MDIETILSGELREILADKNILTGAGYFKLSRLAFKNGFSDAEFKKFLADKGFEKPNENLPLEESEFHIRRF